MWPDKYGSPLPGQKDRYPQDFLQNIYEEVKYGDNKFIIGNPEYKIIAFDLLKGVEKPVKKVPGYVPFSKEMYGDFWDMGIQGSGTPVRDSLRHPDPDPVPEPEPQGKTLDELFAEDEDDQ